MGLNPDALTFARPYLLGLLFVVPVMALLWWWADRRRRRDLLRFGRPSTLFGIIQLDARARRRSRRCLLVGVAAAVTAVAGPRYGKGGEGGVLIGRDLVIVMDLSRSMSADDMADGSTRWEAARRGTAELIAAVRRTGGHRIGLVVFAAKPVVISPLTADYDYVAVRMEEFSPNAAPLDSRPLPDEPFPTGTAIGRALATAYTVHDPRFPGFQDILVLTDGDGPGVESEISSALEEFDAGSIPIHVVGLGNPNNGKELVFGSGDDVEIISTKLQETICKDLARSGRGEYVSARTELPALGSWFEQVLLNRPSREVTDDLIPQPKDRTFLLVVAAVMLFVSSWIREG